MEKTREPLLQTPIREDLLCRFQNALEAYIDGLQMVSNVVCLCSIRLGKRFDSHLYGC